MWEGIKDLVSGWKNRDMDTRLHDKDKFVRPSPINGFDWSKTRPWTYVVGHHSYSRDKAMTNDWLAIEKYHTSWRYNSNIVSEAEAKRLMAQGKEVEAPWPTIGYHFGIEKVNGVYVYQIGCPLNQIGYHCKGFNERAIGICVIGNYGGNFDGSDGEKPNQIVYEMMARLVNYIMFKYKMPKSNFLGHRETYPLLGKTVSKTCPGQHFDLEIVRNAIA